MIEVFGVSTFWDFLRAHEFESYLSKRCTKSASDPRGKKNEYGDIPLREISAQPHRHYIKSI